MVQCLLCACAVMKHAAMFLVLLVGCASDGTSGPDDPAIHQHDTGTAKWCHFAVTSAEGNAMSVDYQIAGSYTAGNVEYIQSAQPVWINVSGDAVAAASAVHVWIGDQSYPSPEGYTTAKQFGDLHTNPDANLDLYASPDADRFTGQLTAGLALSEYFEGDDEATLHAHEFAIELDDTWQTDPISNTHNFLDNNLDVCGQ